MREVLKLSHFENQQTASFEKKFSDTYANDKGRSNEIKFGTKEDTTKQNEREILMYSLCEEEVALWV